MWRAIKRFVALPWRERSLLLEALLALLCARILLLLLPFRVVARMLGRQGTEQTAALTDADLETAQRVGWAVNVLARRVPWDSRCLAQAAAGALMLSRRGLPRTVYIGVRQDAQRPFCAHAWLRCGTRIVTGAPGHETFRVIASFSRGAAP